MLGVPLCKSAIVYWMVNIVAILEITLIVTRCSINVSLNSRYKNNWKILKEGMFKLGFKEFLSPEDAGYIVITYIYPTDPNFKFIEFYQRLYEKGMCYI